MPPKQKKKIIAMERFLFNPIPETPIPQPYFSIPSPAPYRFPLSETILEGIKLLEHYEPQQQNSKIQNKLPNQRVQRMIKYKEHLCLLGKDGNGLLVDGVLMPVRGVSAFGIGPTHLIIAYDDLRLEVYSTQQMKLIKVFKNFSVKKITFLKILSVPKSFESIVILTSEGRKIIVHRIQKSMFSTLSVKLSKQIIGSLEYPVTQMTEIPLGFRFYLRKDTDYRDCSLICISAVNIVYILKINHFRLSMQDFITIDHIRRNNDVSVNCVSWGETKIQAPSRFINGDKLVLTYTFGNQVFFLALREIEKYVGGEIVIKCEWVESYPLKVDEGVVAFCQFMKKSQILMITEDNKVIIFHTKNFEIFEKEIRTQTIEKIVESYKSNLHAKVIGVVPTKKQPQLKMESRDESGLSEFERSMMKEAPLLTYAYTFQYEYPNKQISFLSEKKYEAFLYNDWRVIYEMLKVQQKYESLMLFLIAIHKKANKFDFGVDGTEGEMDEKIQILVLEYIDKKLQNLKNMPEIIKYLTQEDDYFKMVITPIQFLTETEQFSLLFNIVKDKIIDALITDRNSDKSYNQAENIFYEALAIFIEHGRIKYIPDDQLTITLKYFVDHENLGMIDRLAIYFDLQKVDRNILIQCLLKNNLVVSLAHVCTQGSESQFVTPFVKLWGISESYRQTKTEYASMFAIKALWYVQLCLQRNWALKQYSFEKYSDMIRVLSTHFLTDRILVGLLQIKTQYCLETLAFYFTIENSQIICQTDPSRLKLTSRCADWIKRREGFQLLQLLLSSIENYLSHALKNPQKTETFFNLFLSTIIIYKTIKLAEEKYFEILVTLIENYGVIKSMKYGLEQKILDNYRESFEQFVPEGEDAERIRAEAVDKILSARYINKILTLVCYECGSYIKQKFMILQSKATEHNLIDLQAEISFYLGNFGKCIEIYKNSRSYYQNLVFEFLQNSFKKLILEKRKDDKRKLAGCITQNIEWMVQLNPQSTITIIQNFIQEIQDNLIQALSGKEELQLQFLQGIINNQNLVQMKQKLGDDSIARYVELMAKNKKHELIDSFKKNPRFTTEEALRICQHYHVYDCMEYLYERMGNISASVKIASLRIDELLHERSIHTNDDDEYENDTPYIKIKEILDNVIDVCKKNHSQEIWESLLDSFINLYKKYENSGLPEEEVQVFFYINGEVMENLALNCPIEHTIDLLQNKYKDLNMGGKMSHAFSNILNNLSHSINILYIANNLIKSSLQKELAEDFQSKLHCYSTTPICQLCRFGIIKRQKATLFKCGHSYHNECLVGGKEVVICLQCLKRQTEQFDYYLNTLNPQHPKIKKVGDLFDKFDQKRMEMREIFKIQEYERADKKEESVKVEINQKKKNKFELFDEASNQLQVGNRRVLAGLVL